MHPSETVDLLRRTRHVEGWLSFEAAMLFSWIDEIQKRNDVRGDLFEIGVHHGKSAVLLGRMLRGDETLGVCDLFGEQSANISHSGVGDREIFERNMRLALGPISISVFAAASNLLTPQQIGINHRFFHIDGGHNCEEALADLRLARGACHEDAVIVVDDPFRMEWPGVTEAVCRFLNETADYRPVLVGFNKLLLVNEVSADLYATEFDKEAEQKRHNIVYPWELKSLPFVGSLMRIFYIPSYLSYDSSRARLARFWRVSRMAQMPLIGSIARFG
jgi:hypothetical protein